MLRAYVDFSKRLRDWDGFGITYTGGVRRIPQSEKVFMSLQQENRLRLLESLFGSDGMRAAIIRLYLDPAYDLLSQPYRSPEESTINVSEYAFEADSCDVCAFCTEARRVVAGWGGDLKLITTALSPPGWMTKQKEPGGRDLDPVYRNDFARFMVAWVKYLRERDLPVKYLSLHNAGERWYLWNETGVVMHEKGVRAIYWPPEQVVDFLKLVRRTLDRNGLQDVLLTPGEVQNWVRFYEWGYADALREDPQALASLGLLTSNSFADFNCQNRYGDWRSTGVDLIREQYPDLHAWVIANRAPMLHSDLVSEIHNHIYGSKINAIIFDTGLRDEVSGVVLSGSTLLSLEAGNLNQESLYHYLKVMCRAGQPGMSVCQVACNGPEVSITGFSSNETPHPDTFVVINTGTGETELPIEIRGSASGGFQVYRSSPRENYAKLGAIPVREGKVLYRASSQSVTAFFGMF